MDETCKTCGAGRTPLFRILDSYEYGEYMREQNCEDCKYGDFFGGFSELLEKYPDLTPDEHKEMQNSSCYECESRPYQNTNTLNLTIAVVGSQLMFEDKKKGCYKRYVNINFCPACGRDLRLKKS